jgi:1-acyl-sn-glycerol-3-phosphate acyltransferase
MIRDAKGGLFTRVLEWYVARKVRTAFRGVWVRGELPSSEGGLLCYLNHSSFWDGFIVHQLAQVAGWDGYAVMEEANLSRYPFHRRIGAFSVRRGEAKSALETLRYAARDVLRRPGAAVMIFPEGELRGGAGPLQPLRGGVEALARLARVRSVPIALRYAFLEHEHPDVLIEVGAPHAAAPLEHYAAELATVYARVNAATSLDGFRRVITGRRSVQERWDGARGLESTSSPHGAQSPRLAAKA